MINSNNMTMTTSQGKTSSGITNGDRVLDEHVQEILFSKTAFSSKREVLEKFQNLDSLKFYYIVKELEKELGFIKLENIILNQFLEKNDPKYLIGLKQTLEERSKVDKSTQKIQFSQKKSIGSSMHSLARTNYGTGSMASIGSTFSATGRQGDGRLNYSIKSEICEKYFMEVKKKFEKNKTQTMSQIKCRRAKIDELSYFNNEIRGTIVSFQDVVINIGYNPKTGKIPAEKFIKFFVIWNKNSMGLLNNLRLNIQTLREQCYQLKILIIKKADLAGMLGPADFEQMKIKKETFTKELEDRNSQLMKIKSVTGKASSALAAQRYMLLNLENQVKRIIGKINDSEISTKKMEREIVAVDTEIVKVQKSTIAIDDKIIKYHAPNVAEYIEQNDKLIQLERKEKLLKRQVGILTLKLKNLKMKIMQKNRKI